MVVKFIEIFLEYLAIVLCMHKVAKTRLEFNKWLFLTFAIEQAIFLLIWNGMYIYMISTMILHPMNHFVNEDIECLKTRF